MDCSRVSCSIVGYCGVVCTLVIVVDNDAFGGGNNEDVFGAPIGSCDAGVVIIVAPTASLLL